MDEFDAIRKNRRQRGREARQRVMDRVHNPQPVQQEVDEFAAVRNRKPASSSSLAGILSPEDSALYAASAIGRENAERESIKRKSEQNRQAFDAAGLGFGGQRFNEHMNAVKNFASDVNSREENTRQPSDLLSKAIDLVQPVSDAFTRVNEWAFGKPPEGPGNGAPDLFKIPQMINDTNINIPGTRIDDNAANFVRGWGDMSSFGLSGYLDQQMGHPERTEGARETGWGKAGQVGGALTGYGAAYKAADKVVPKLLNKGAGLLPKGVKEGAESLVRSKGIDLGRAAQVGSRGAAAGLGFGLARETGEQTFGINDQTLRERAIDVGIDAAFGGVGDTALSAVGHALRNTRLGQSFANFMNRGKAEVLPPQSPQGTLALPAPKQRGNANRTQSPDVIYGEGKVEPIGLPQGNIIKGTRLRPVGAEQTLDNVMGRIKPIVTQRMTPPLENPNELAKWVRGHLGESNISLNEVRQLPYEDLRQMAEMMRNRLNVHDEAVKAAHELGHDLPSLLDGKAPTLGQRVAENSKERTYGLYPNELPNVRRPETFRTSVQNPAAAPVERVGRAPTAGRADEFDAVRNRTRQGAQPSVLNEVSARGPEAQPNEFDVIRNRNRQPAALNEVAATAPASAAQPVQQMHNAQNYAGNPIPFRQGTPQSDRTISRTQVIKNMRKNMGVVIDTGRLSGKGKGVLGEFKVRPEVIRSRQAEDIQVISHEIGHNLDKRFGLTDPQYQNELVNLVNTANPGHLANYAAAQHMDEAIAEYVRLRLVNPQQARQLAPNFTRYFERKVNARTLKGLEASQRDVDTWITQGEYEQAKGLIDFDNKPKSGFNFDKWYTRHVDDLNPLNLAEKALKGKQGLGSESIYKMARLSRGIAEKAKLAITRGIYDAQGNKLVDGLAQIVRPLEKLGVKERDFATYLSVKHALDLKAMGKQVPFDNAQINAVMARMNTPEIQAVQQNVVRWNNALMDILVEGQVINPTAVTQMRKMYPNYVPFMRYFDDDAIAGFKNGGYGSAKGFANITNPVKKMSEEGSTRTIINPFESMVNNTFLVMNAAAKNKVGLQLAELSKIDGAGALIEHVGEGARIGKEHIIDVFENGVRQQYKIREPELYNAMLSLDTESTNSLIKFLGGVAGILRSGATLTPEFIVRNPMRDVVGATVNSVKYGFNPIDFGKGLFHVLGRTKKFDQFLSSGGGYGTLMALDRDANREALQLVFRTSLKEKAMNVVTSPKELAKFLSGYTPVKSVIGGLRKASEVTELATKVGAFNKTLKKTGDLEEAAYIARDLMDFNRAGSSIRQANRAVAFMNAAIQGTDKMMRAFKENPAAFAIRAFTTMVLPSIGLYYWNRNLPEEMRKKYENIPQWQKDTFFIIGIPGLNEFVRLPKPFEVGMLFATGTDRILRWFEDNDRQAFKDYEKATLEAFTPPVMLTALTPLLEAITNYSFFRKAPIVPLGDQRFEKKDQYGMFTSETAKGIGNLLSKTPLKDSNFSSPRIIDNTIKGYTAGLGQYAVSAIDTVIKGVKKDSGPVLPEKKLTEQPFFRSFFVNTSGGGQIREEFYEKWDKISKRRASAIRNQTPFNDPSYGLLNTGKKLIDLLNKQYKMVQQDPNMSAAEKRARLDLLDEQMNEVAATSLGK